MRFTVTAKANFAPAIADPLINTASALRWSINDGGFIDTNYAMSKRRTWRSSGETHFVFANNTVLDHGVGIAPVPPSSPNENSLVVHYQTESRPTRDAELYRDYDLDSDIEEQEIKQGAPSQPPPYCSQSYSSGAAPAESDFSDTTSDTSALGSDDDNLGWTESAVAWPPGFYSTDTLTAEPLSRPFSPTQGVSSEHSIRDASY
ncbi:uncharacterized protein BJ212DRAFT_903707 [Suillus subaureus]|uniref:Uncharacterized protein n=1 Tax=Suillus subaureus TaxID=48587 RepID=A0A9P7JGU6_9AGAM|nr:uncharacterized protein BJ212DRAFT_903707 [Suillus subaureus]KAG1821531.1 hypothetical protein BJ212DRAFT_903707 [Suillus subaureus]